LKSTSRNAHDCPFAILGKFLQEGSMGRINIGRLILAGLVAGLIADALAYLVDGVILAERWSDAMGFLNHHQFSLMQWVWFNVVGLLGGLIAIWIYVGIRPRFGAGPLTAVYAGIAVWLLTSAIPNFEFMWVLNLFEHHLTIFTTLGALVEIVVGTVLGAAIYQEDED
jgi:hypothetical protein